MTTVCSRGDETFSFSSLGVHEPWASRAAMPHANPVSADVLAVLSGKLPPKVGDLAGVLLTCAFPVNDRGCQVLHPLWAEEAMHRAYGFMRLLGTRIRHRQSNRDAAGPGDAIASDLAVQFRELETGGERAVVPCSAILTNVVCGLVALFGCPANVAIRTKIEEVSLPAYKRRALVLAASELVDNALLHAFQGRESGLIGVRLTARGPGTACLHVADNGIGFTDSPPNLDCGVASGLAGLLEADLAYDRIASWTIAEIRFPCFGGLA
jgi:hypothetical protein